MTSTTDDMRRNRRSPLLHDLIEGHLVLVAASLATAVVLERVGPPAGAASSGWAALAAICVLSRLPGSAGPVAWRLAFAGGGFGLAAVGGAAGFAGAVLATALLAPGLLLAQRPGGGLESLLWGVYPGAFAGLAGVLLALRPDGSAPWPGIAAAAVAVALSVGSASATARDADLLALADAAEARLRIAPTLADAGIRMLICGLLAYSFNWLA